VHKLYVQRSEHCMMQDIEFF